MTSAGRLTALKFFTQAPRILPEGTISECIKSPFQNIISDNSSTLSHSLDENGTKTNKRPRKSSKTNSNSSNSKFSTSSENEAFKTALLHVSPSITKFTAWQRTPTKTSLFGHSRRSLSFIRLMSDHNGSTEKTGLVSAAKESHVFPEITNSKNNSFSITDLDQFIQRTLPEFSTMIPVGYTCISKELLNRLDFACRRVEVKNYSDNPPNIIISP